MSTKRDYYEILGLAKSASKSEIKSAYRKMALKFHPDKNKAKDAEEKFKEINEAYQILSDDQKKQTYDQFGHTAFDPSRGGGMGGNPFSGAQGGPFTWSYTSKGGGASSNQDFGFDMNDPFDIFEQFFGGGFGRTARRPRYGVKISFMEAVHGVKKEIEVDGEKRSVKIPAGASDGTRIRFDKFDVTVDVGTHERFKRDGFDVFIIEKITFSLAAFGGQVEVPTLTDKKLKLKIRPGTQSHSLIRLRGEGIQRLQRRGKGDLYIRIVIEVPEKMDQAQKKALRRLEEAGL